MAIKEFMGRHIPFSDTDSNWILANPVLGIGERVAATLDDGSIKIKTGDGVSHYADLPFDDEPLKEYTDQKIEELSDEIAYIQKEDSEDVVDPEMGTPEDAGKLLYIGLDGKVSMLVLGAGLQIIDGVLTITNIEPDEPDEPDEPTEQEILFIDNGDGTVTISGVEFVDQGDGTVLMSGAAFVETTDGVLITKNEAPDPEDTLVAFTDNGDGSATVQGVTFEDQGGGVVLMSGYSYNSEE